MSSLLVDTLSFDAAAVSAGKLAARVERVVSRASAGLGGLGHMAGSDENGLKWAEAYDTAARKLFGYGTQLQDGVSTLARKLAVTGYYYEVAELANAGENFDELSLPPTIHAGTTPHVPSAAGGNRAFALSYPAAEWVAEAIANIIGKMWPDGDTAKLDEASRVWHRFADDLDDVAAGLSSVVDALHGIHTPEVGRAHDAVHQVRDYARQLAKAARELGKAGSDLSGKIAYVHAQTEITVGIAVAAILATAAVALGLTPFTFGISDAVGVAGVAGETAGAAATIMGFIAEFAAGLSETIAGVVGAGMSMVGASAGLASAIGVTVGNATVAGLAWGAAGAVENTIVTGVTEPGADLDAAAGQGFIEWGAGGALGAGLLRAAQIAGTSSESAALSKVLRDDYDFGGLSEQEFIAKWSDGVGDHGPNWKWPPDRGFDGPALPNTLEPGQIIDRITATRSNGSLADGNFASPAGAQTPGRSLPPDRMQPPFATVTYRVLKPLPPEVLEGKAAPWFDQPGGAIQYDFPGGIGGYVDAGYLEVIGVTPK